MYKSIKAHLGQSQELIMSIEIYLKCKYTYENAGFCILCIDDFKLLKILIYQTIESFHDFSPSNVTGANPPPPPTPYRPYDVSRGQNRYVTLLLYAQEELKTTGTS